MYFVVLSNSSAIFNITLEVNFDAGKNSAVAKYFIQLTLEMCVERNGKKGNGKETGKNAFLSFPVPTNFDQRTSLLPTFRADIFVIRHLFSVLFSATDSSLLCTSVVS